jgi:hypothetical protein
MGSITAGDQTEQVREKNMKTIAEERGYNGFSLMKRA